MTLSPDYGAARSGGWPGWTTIRPASGPCCSIRRARCSSTTPAAAILELVDGTRTVAQIAAELGERYQTDVAADVTEYLSHLAERELIQ